MEIRSAVKHDAPPSRDATPEEVQSPMLHIEDAPLSWFDRPAYHPRLRGGGKDSWFLLDPAFRPIEEVPREAPPEPRAGREALAAALEETYAAWRLPRSAASDSGTDALRAPGTAAIVAGQQPGFLGGPLLTAFKAIGAIAAARRVRSLTGRPCVPVFWVLGEDHDFEEARDAYLPGPGGAETLFRLPGEPDRRPLSAYPMDAAAMEVVGAAARHLAPRRHGELARALLELYRGRDLAGGFAAILAEILGPSGLVLLDPARLRAPARPLFQKVIEDPAGVLAAIERGRADVAGKGIEPLVAARLPLFLLRDGRRHHLSPAPGGLQVDGGGPSFTTRELLALLDEDPVPFSSGALLRPIVQDAVLPCALTIGGPAEVGYFAQIGPLAKLLGSRPPRIAFRPDATIVDGKAARTAESVGLEAIARASGPEDLLRPEPEPPSLGAAREAARLARDAIARAVGELATEDRAPRLLRKAEESAGGILQVADRLAQMRLERRSGEMDAARALWSLVFPSGQLQERRFPALHFIAKHGTGWVEELIRAIEPDPLRVAHRWAAFGPQDED
jgi:bacillithiol biosynthesis cysteine-adding enzyme BshC